MLTGNEETKNWKNEVLSSLLSVKKTGAPRTQQANFPSVIWIHIHKNEKSLILITIPRILPQGIQAVCGSLAAST